MKQLFSQRSLIVILLFSFVLIQCKSTPSGNNEEEPENSEEPVSFEPIDETIPAGDQDPGFFLDNWQSREISPPQYIEKTKPQGKLDSRIQVNTENVITRVPGSLFGNNTNPYIGPMVTEPTLLQHLRNLNPQYIRFPGGNLSNVYFWDREQGNYPNNAPPADELLDAQGNKRENESYWYGQYEAGWTMSLSQYYQMLDETNSQGVITVNYGYARYGKDETPVETAAGYAADWVRHDNGRTRYWEIGNENYGTWQAGYRIDTSTNQDGQPQLINGKLYAEHVKVFVDSMKKAAQEIGTDIKIGAQLIEREVTESWETDIVRNWNQRFFLAGGDEVVDFYIVHNYYTPYNEDSPPSVILSSAHEVTSDMMGWMNETTQNNGAALKPVTLTEWNIFSTGSQQMVSDISGMHASMVLGELIKYEYGLANRWNIGNGWSEGNDHGMFNLGDAPGGVPKWKPRPDFYHMYFFQKIFGDHMVWSGTQGDDDLVSYASTFSSGQVGLVVANTSDSEKLFDVEFKNFISGSRYYWYTLEGGDEGTFSRKVLVNGEGPDAAAGGPDNYDNLEAFSANTSGDEGIKLEAPGHSVLYILVDGQ